MSLSRRFSPFTAWRTHREVVITCLPLPLTRIVEAASGPFKRLICISLSPWCLCGTGCRAGLFVTDGFSLLSASESDSSCQYLHCAFRPLWFSSSLRILALSLWTCLPQATSQELPRVFTPAFLLKIRPWRAKDPTWHVCFLTIAFALQNQSSLQQP